MYFKEQEKRTLITYYMCINKHLSFSIGDALTICPFCGNHKLEVVSPRLIKTPNDNNIGKGVFEVFSPWEDLIYKYNATIAWDAAKFIWGIIPESIEEIKENQ
jgi:hypothetical protein